MDSKRFTLVEIKMDKGLFAYSNYTNYTALIKYGCGEFGIKLGKSFVITSVQKELEPSCRMEKYSIKRLCSMYLSQHKGVNVCNLKRVTHGKKGGLRFTGDIILQVLLNLLSL